MDKRVVDSGRVGKRTKEALVDGLKWLVNDASLGDVLFFCLCVFFGFLVFFFSSLFCLSVCHSAGGTGENENNNNNNGWKVCSENGS